MQYRVAPEGGVRDIDESKRQVLVSYPWEVIDSYDSDFSRDCFDDELRTALPISVWQHDRKEPIGRAFEWQKTNRANELVVRFSNFEAVPRARQAFTQIKDGELTDWSYGFDRGKSVPHPSGERGQIRFMKARMAEISPVSVGSIPGAVTVGFRSVDVAALRAMVDDHQITQDEARSILGLDVPIIGERQAEGPAEADPEAQTATEEPAERERIEVRVAGEPETRVVELESGVRSVVLTIADDGTVSASGYAGDGGQAADDSPTAADSGDAGELAGAVDAALDAMAGLLAGVDTTDLPPVVQQALALADAAGVAVDELLEEMGVPDPDSDDGDRAAKAGDAVTVGKKSGKVKKVMPNGALLVDWGDGKSSLVAADDATEADAARAAEDDSTDDPERAAKDPKKPYGDVEYADPKNGKYPIDTAAHVKAALSYIGQEKNAAEYPLNGVTLASVKANIEAAAKKFGIGDRAAEPEQDPTVDDPDLAAARAALDLLAVR